MEEQEVQKRLTSLEAGFHIVATQVVGAIEEVGKDVRELGREVREASRDQRELKRDMTASFRQISATMATKDDVDTFEERMNTRMNLLASKMDQVIDLLSKGK